MTISNHAIAFLIIVCALPLVLSSCSCPVTGEKAAQSTQQQEITTMEPLSTSVWYRERSLLPPGSTLTVTLEDVSRMDVAAEILDKQTVVLDGAPPYDVELSYDPSMIDDRMRYSLRARIEKDGQLLFINTKAIDPFEEGAIRPVEIMVEKQGLGTASKTAAANLLNTDWKVLRINGQDVVIGEGEKELSMVLTSDNSVRGFAGCNHFTGSFTQKDENLEFGLLATTQMMCSDNQVMDQEMQFHKALRVTKNYRITAENLSLVDGSGKIVVLFVSRNMQ